MASNTKQLVIIGGGPAALTAALYSARAGIETQVFERANIGGLLGEIAKLDNYPGYAGAGNELASQMQRQAEAAGAQISYGECSAVRPADGHAGFELIIDGVAVRAGAVLVATGAEPKPLPFVVAPPVSYCALCDGARAKGQDVVVVGGANAAVQESLYLANLAKSVTIITHSALKADYALREQLTKTPNIKLIEHQEPTPEFLNQFAYVFVCIGRTPATSFLRNLPILDQDGYILTNLEAATAPSETAATPSETSIRKPTHMTALPGLFAAGDVRAASVHQVIAAAGDGAVAATEIAQFNNL